MNSTDGDTALALKIGLIDSGAGEGCCAAAVTEVAFPPDGETSGVPVLGHGALIASVLCSQVRVPVALHSARVFFRRLSCSPAQVAAALDWQVQRRVRLVNMSFGLRADRAVLRHACARATRAGIILVGATPARGDPVYPASYPGVIRATGDARCAPGEIAFLHSRYADFGGCVRAGQEVAGASAGCAHVAAALIHLLGEDPEATRERCRARLAARASYLGIESRSWTKP